MKYVLLLLLLAAAAGLLYWRLRPYIALIRRFLGVVREVNGTRPQAPADLPRRGPAGSGPGERLARCAVCGTWVAASRAVNMRSTRTTYCSHSCLERAAAGPQRIRRTAS